MKNFEGIIHTEVGYTGGNDNPSYESVCNGDGNIEVVKIIYNEAKISLEQILSLFFKIHDPTSFDKQGADIEFNIVRQFFMKTKAIKIP